MLLLQLPGRPILTINILKSLYWLKVQERIEYKVIISTAYSLSTSSLLIVHSS